MHKYNTWRDFKSWKDLEKIYWNANEGDILECLCCENDFVRGTICFEGLCNSCYKEFARQKFQYHCAIVTDNNGDGMKYAGTSDVLEWLKIKKS